jgi:hypothetical protein
MARVSIKVLGITSETTKEKVRSSVISDTPVKGPWAKTLNSSFLAPSGIVMMMFTSFKRTSQFISMTLRLNTPMSLYLSATLRSI